MSHWLCITFRIMNSQNLKFCGRSEEIKSYVLDVGISVNSKSQWDLRAKAHICVVSYERCNFKPVAGIRKLNIYIFNPGCFTMITGEQPLYCTDPYPLSSQEGSHYSFFFSSSIQLNRQERCSVPVCMYYLKNTHPFHAPQLRWRI